MTERRGDLAGALSIALRLDLNSVRLSAVCQFASLFNSACDARSVYVVKRCLAIVNRMLDEADAGAPSVSSLSSSTAPSSLSRAIGAMDDDTLAKLLLMVRDWHATRRYGFIFGSVCAFSWPRLDVSSRFAYNFMLGSLQRRAGRRAHVAHRARNSNAKGNVIFNDLRST